MAQHTMRTGINDLPQELIDQITEDVIDDRADKRGRRVLKILRRVNGAFYWSSTRLLFRSIRLHLRGYGPVIPRALDIFSLGEQRRFVQNVLITGLNCHPPSRTAEVRAQIREVPRILARFPALRRIYVRFRQRSSFSEPFESDPLIAPWWESLQFYPPKLDTLYLRGQQVPFPSPTAVNGPGLAAIMQNLRCLDYSNDSFNTPVPRPPVQTEIFRELQHAGKLERLRLEAVGIVRTKSLELISLAAPLRVLEITFTTFRAFDLFAIGNFLGTLESLRLIKVWISVGLWEDVFNVLRRSRSLTKLYVCNGWGYHPTQRSGVADKPYDGDIVAHKICMDQVYRNRARLGRQGRAEEDDNYPQIDHQDRYVSFKSAESMGIAQGMHYGVFPRRFNQPLPFKSMDKLAECFVGIYEGVWY